MDHMNLSIIIPALNEEHRIRPTLEHYAAAFPKQTEIIVVINGTTDNTLKVVQDVAKKYSYIQYMNFPEKIGKGGAIIEGFKKAKGTYLCFVDADSSTEPDQIEKLYHELQTSDYAGIIGSRWMKGSVIKKYQPLSRIIASRVYNLLVRYYLGLHLKDSQCGAKIFRKEAIIDVLPEILPTTWEFDVSLLYTLHKRGYRVKEVPIVWEDKLGSNLKIRLTAPKMFKSLMQIKKGKKI